MKKNILLATLLLMFAVSEVQAMQHGASYRIRVYCVDSLKTKKIMKNKSDSLKLDAVFSTDRFEKFILSPDDYDLAERICERMRVLTTGDPILKGTNAGDYETAATSYPVRRSKPKVVEVDIDPPIEVDGENLPVVNPNPKENKKGWFSWVPQMFTYLGSASQVPEIEEDVSESITNCPPFLRDFEDDCEYYIRYYKIKKALIEKDVSVENLAYYRAIRLINQKDLSAPRNRANILQPWFIYKPFKTWFYWEEGNRFLLLLQELLKDQQNENEDQQQGKLFTLTLDHLRSHHQRYMDKELTAPDWTKKSDFLKWVGSIYIKNKPDPGYFRPYNQTSSGFWLKYLNETETTYVKNYDMVTESMVTQGNWVPTVDS